MTAPKRNTIARKIRKQSDIQRKFKAYRKLHKDGREGGRHHSAISSRKDLSPGEKLVLHTIGAAHDYRSHLFTSPVSLSLTFICNETSLSPSGVRKLTKQLEEKGLLIVTRRKDIHGADVPSLYQLTWKLFKDYITSTYGKRLARIAAMPGGAPEPDPGNDGPGKKDTDHPVSEESVASEKPGPGLRLVYSSSPTSFWEPGPASGWGGNFTWRGIITDSDQNETPSRVDALSEGEITPSEPVEKEMPIRTDALIESSPALSEGEPSPSGALLFLSSSSSSSKEDLNPPISPLADAKGDLELKRSRIRRCDKASYRHLMVLALSTHEQWRRYAGRPEIWQSSGFESFDDLQASYYPPYVLRIGARISQKFNRGDVGRKKKGQVDEDFWFDQLRLELRKLNAEGCIQTITDIDFLEIQDLISHGMRVSCERDQYAICSG